MSAIDWQNAIISLPGNGAKIKKKKIIIIIFGVNFANDAPSELQFACMFFYKNCGILSPNPLDVGANQSLYG